MRRALFVLLALLACLHQKEPTCVSIDTCAALANAGYQLVKCCTPTACVVTIEDTSDSNNPSVHPTQQDIVCDGLDCTNALWDIEQQYCGPSH